AHESWTLLETLLVVKFLSSTGTRYSLNVFPMRSLTFIQDSSFCTPHIWWKDSCKSFNSADVSLKSFSLPKAPDSAFPVVFQSPEFEAHLVNSGAYLFMCHDGALAEEEADKVQSDEVSDSESENDHEELEENTAEVSVHKAIFRAGFRRMIHWFITHGYNISLINSLEFRDTKVCKTLSTGLSHKY
ncbi:hypothetical protein N7486_003651, partial [Penicillium sp. IBT 16267x]